MRTLLVIVLVAASQNFARSGDGDARPRIISLYAAHTEVLLRLGARDHVIGVSAQETYGGPETESWEPPVFSIRDDVEKFLVARPDIVLVRPQHLGGGARLAAALERAGIEVRALQVTQASGLYDYWRELGALVGRTEAAEDMVARFAATVERYRAAADRMADKPGVFVEAMRREVKTFAPGSIPLWLVELAGGRNVAADARPATPGVAIADFGPERLLAVANEVEVFVSQQGAMNRVSEAELRGRRIYQPLAAFRSGRVYRIPEPLLSRPTPSLLEGLALLASWTGLELEE